MCASTAGIILAGGRSSRMGRDKALLTLAGKPLIAHAAELLSSANLSISVAASRPDLAAFGKVIPDRESGRGPLQGVCRSLAEVQAELTVFVTIDTPLIPASLIAFLLSRAMVTGMPATLASVNGFAQTFPAVLRRDALPALENELANGNGSCFAAFQAAAAAQNCELCVVPVELLAQAGHVHHPGGLPPHQWFLNVNTPEELERAGRLISG